MKFDHDRNYSSTRRSEVDIFPHILKYLYRNGSASLSQLITGLRIESESLMRAVYSLKKNGFIRLDQISGLPADESIVMLEEDQVYFIGVDLGGTKLYAGISNLAGKILHDIEIRHGGQSGELCYELLVDVINSLLEHASENRYRIRGIGVQVPGRVQLETGMVVMAAAVQWESFPLKQMLESKFELPVVVDNDLKQSALGEAWFGAGKSSTHVVLVAIGTGIAASMVVNDVLQRGAHLRHGEVGWMLPGREFLGKHYQGYGALESEASGTGIAKRARSLLTGEWSEEDLESLTAEDVFDKAREGETWAMSVVSETVEYLALLIGNLMAFYDPDVIILSGGVIRAHDLLVKPVLKLLEGCLLIPPNIVVSSLGYQAGVLGAMVNFLVNCPDIYQASKIARS